MNVENTDVETTLLKSECYICLETCLQKSPCECASHVHPKCLIHFVEMSGNTQCTICTGQYPVPPPPPPPKLSLTPHKILLFTVFCCLLFFPFGWLGSCISGDCEGYDPFSMISCFFGHGRLFYNVICVGCLK